MIEQNFTIADILDANNVPIDAATVANTPAFQMKMMIIDFWLDYLLRDEIGEPITDESDATISLEGLNYA